MAVGILENALLLRTGAVWSGPTSPTVSTDGGSIFLDGVAKDWLTADDLVLTTLTASQAEAARSDPTDFAVTSPPQVDDLSPWSLPFVV